MEKLVTLTTVRFEHEAEILKACLEANGIRCVIAGAQAASTAGAFNVLTTTWENPLGGISIRVRESDLEAAQEFLRSVEDAATPRRKERSPLAEWIAHIENGLRAVPLPLRIVLIIFGSLWLAGSLGMALAGLLQKLPR
jgi:hypothetical protein